MRKKLKDSGGLTLVEMLCTVAILVLLCLMMNTGLQMALRNYDILTAESETHLLFGSLSNALIDKLRYAVVTKNGETESWSIGEVKSKEGKIVVEEKDASGGITAKQLLPDDAYGAGRWEYKVENIEKDGHELPLVKYEEGRFIVNFKVVWEKDGKISVQTPEDGLIIRCLNPIKT